MKRIIHPSSAALAALLLCSLASAQGVSGNLNDLRLHNGGDLLFDYSNGVVTPGLSAGQLGPPWTTNVYFWKVFSRDTLRHCDGFLEISGVQYSQYDSDWTTDVPGNNTVTPDWWWSEQDPAGPQGGPPNTPVGTILPDTSFGLYIAAPAPPLGFVNNDFLPPICPATAAEITGYEIQLDMTGGLGSPSGIFIDATGTKDFVWTIFVPAGQIDTGTNLLNVCTPAGTNGDCSFADMHSTDKGANPLDGETQFDWLGTGDSAFGGSFDPSTSTTIIDDVAEINCNTLEFTQPIVAMNVNSNTGHVDSGPSAVPPLFLDVPGVPETMLEEGLAGIHYRVSGSAGGRLSARLYDWQGAGRLCVIWGALSTLPCVNFKGSKLGVNVADVLGKFFVGLWISAAGPHLTDNQYVATTTDYDDATYRAPPLPLPASFGLPANTRVKLFFQAFHKSPFPPFITGSQITTWYLHIP